MSKVFVLSTTSSAGSGEPDSSLLSRVVQISMAEPVTRRSLSRPTPGCALSAPEAHSCECKGGGGGGPNFAHNEPRYSHNMSTANNSLSSTQRASHLNMN